MKIVYLHHAQRDTENGVNQDNALTQFGVQEAELIGEMLRNVPVSSIYHGEYKRYKLTAEFINRHIKAPLVMDNRLNERCRERDKGDNFTIRTHSFLDDTIARHDNSDVIFCVTSGGNLNEFLNYFHRGEPIEGFKRIQAIGVSPINFEFDKENNADYIPFTDWTKFNKDFSGGKNK